MGGGGFLGGVAFAVTSSSMKTRLSIPGSPSSDVSSSVATGATSARRERGGWRERQNLTTSNQTLNALTMFLTQTFH